MFNVLLVSDQLSLFEHLIERLRLDFFNVYVNTHNEITQTQYGDEKYDFILMHFDKDEHKSISDIEKIKKHSQCPLYIFSTGHSNDEITKFLGYGAEGHIDIPFNHDLVVARIKAVLRFLHQIKRSPGNIIRYGKLVLHIDNRAVLVDGKHIPLTNVEFRIFQILCENRDTVVSKDKMIQHVWDENSSATDNALGIHITRLRKKLSCEEGVDLIETVWGLGYRLNVKPCEKQ